MTVSIFTELPEVGACVLGITFMVLPPNVMVGVEKGRPVVGFEV